MYETFVFTCQVKQSIRVPPRRWFGKERFRETQLCMDLNQDLPGVVHTLMKG